MSAFGDFKSTSTELTSGQAVAGTHAISLHPISRQRHSIKQGTELCCQYVVFGWRMRRFFPHRLATGLSN